MRKLFILSTLTIFILLSVLFFLLPRMDPSYRFQVLETGNVIMALLTLAAYLLVDRQLENGPNAFIRGVYGASFLKLMVCMISILVYVLLNRTTIHKPSVFVLFGIYAVYTITETWLLSRMAREKE